MKQRSPISIQRYAYTVAGPCDFAINFAINATVAWLLFRSQAEVAWFGPHSVSYVLVAIAFFCGTFATFFGYFNAIRERRAGKVLPPCDPSQPWAKVAWIRALTRGITVGAAILGFALVISRLFSDATISSQWAIFLVGTYAGWLGYWVHTSAIIRAGALNVPSQSAEVTT